MVINIYTIEVIIAVIIAIILRVIIQKGEFVLPKVYKEGNDTRFNLGSIGVIIVAIVGVFATGTLSPDMLSSPVAAFTAAYAVPSVLDGVVTKALPGNEKDNVTISEEEYKKLDNEAA